MSYFEKQTVRSDLRPVYRNIVVIVGYSVGDRVVRLIQR